MPRRWVHEVSVDWLKARRHVVTATDVVGLVSEYKRLKKKPLKPGEVSLGFAGLWAEKHSEDDPDPVSTGAAARGHILEPYAVESWNLNNPDEVYHHWDDCIIVRNGLGFSPDAMSYSQSKYLNAVLLKATKIEVPKSIMEIKSYEPKHHMKEVLKGKMEHDEIMQLAVAFTIMPKLESARLLFYCPEAPIQMHSELYTRDDLKEQIEIVKQVWAVYRDTDKLLRGRKGTMKSAYTINEIWKEFQEEQQLKSNNIFIL